MTPTLHHFPKQRPLPAAACQRNDAGRRALVLPRRGRGSYSRPSKQSDRERQTAVMGAAGAFSYWLGLRRGNTRDTGVASRLQAGSPSAVLQPAVKRESVVECHARATYPSRPALIAAICASWTIAVVVGVALVGGLT